MKRIILYAVTLEILYLSLSFLICQVFGQWSVTGEVIRTVFRIVSIAILGYFYQKYFYNENRSFQGKTLFTAEFNVAVVLLFLFAVIYTNSANESLWWQFVFVISGFAAGLREELFYRGIIQNSLQKIYDDKTGLSIATILFTLSHVQYIYYGQIQGLLFIAIAGVIFGAIFIYTGSVVIAATVHGLYDAFLSVNLSSIKLSNEAALPTLLLIMVVYMSLLNKKTYPVQSKSKGAHNKNPDTWSLG
jgi:membrane protease YdiL (CAAX protease family)